MFPETPRERADREAFMARMRSLCGEDRQRVSNFLDEIEPLNTMNALPSGISDPRHSILGTPAPTQKLQLNSDPNPSVEDRLERIENLLGRIASSLHSKSWHSR